MEHFDVIIVGGGSAGLSALKKISDLGKQAVLLEAGKKIGSKNVSGGILYSKKPEYGKVSNVEDIYGEKFLEDNPCERLITKYILHTTSKDKIYSMDLTTAHEYQSNFGYSVLLNKLNSWFAKEAEESASKYGGGIVTGVHVKSIRWDDNNSKFKTIVETDELDEFETKAIIAADGVNSEIAEILKAREKFNSSQLYQGVKVVVKLPEEIIEQRFNLESDTGSAHLFSGDITQDHIGGGFLYTNRESLSIGGVYHYDSLFNKPIEPFNLINTMIKHPFIKEYIKDKIPITKIDKTLTPKEVQIKTAKLARFTNKWNEIRQIYYSPKLRQELIKNGRFKNLQDIKLEMDRITQTLEELGTEFMDGYNELEYSAKLVPDGKRCRMDKPFYKNVLFIGDAAGRGLFFGPRIEGLNVGIDDAARAANVVSVAIEKNNFESENMGKKYRTEIENSPYTKDMKRIDKKYLQVIIQSAKKIPIETVGKKYQLAMKIFSNNALLDFAVNIINKIGYNNFLSFVESENTYIKTPIEIAEKLGKKISNTYEVEIPSIEERIGKLEYYEDTKPHIKVVKPSSNFMKNMTIMCPTKCYSLEENKVVLQHEGCIECGTCSKETIWNHPKGEKGIFFRYG
ncbi:MAG: electron transfer flavoprotein [Nitrososphaeraceae archaeon]